MIENKKNGTIEFLRFIFCMCVLLFHAEKYVLGEASLKNGIHLAFFPHGSLGVEFFFLITGLLLARSIDKELSKNTKTDDNIGEDTVKFIFRKIKAIFPYHIVAFITIFIVQSIISKYTLFKGCLILISSIPSIFLIQMSGIPGTSLNHIEWYLSVMLICITIIYPLCKKYYKTFVTLIAPVSSLLILGYLGYNYSCLTGVMVWTTFTYKSVLRGLAEIMLGTSAYYIAKKISQIEFKKSATVFMSLIELLLYIISLFIIMYTFPKRYEFIVLIVLFLAIILSYSQKTFSKNLFNNNIVYFLGKFSLPIYVSQLSAVKIVNYYFSTFSYACRISLIIIITFVLAIITMIIGDYISQKMNINKNKKHLKSA